ncbi:MAG: 30S ribosomal protein S4 [Chloroflexi bacterium]|nr:30S ribosomal protein S4 [Chloroflexota bacterium]
MARYTGPVCRQCRRNGNKLFLKGERCYTPRCAIEKHRGKPGQQASQMMRSRITEYGTQLQEKQKARQMYGVLERQFKNYIDRANRMSGVTGDRLLQLLERRLDNAVYRMGFADSRNQARQLVNHGHFTVNGRKASIPSFLIKQGDLVSWREQSRKTEIFKIVSESLGKRPTPTWLTVDTGEVTGSITTLPEPTEIDSAIDTRMIVEFYSRR